MSTSGKLTIDWESFAATLKAERSLQGKSIRIASAEVGISAATLCRAEIGREISAENYLILCHHFNKSPMEFACFTGNIRGGQAGGGNSIKAKDAERSIKYFTSAECRKCGAPYEKGRPFCQLCRDRRIEQAYLKSQEIKKPLQVEKVLAIAKKANARSYANVYVRRGLLMRQPCWCGAPAEKHHMDYSKPLEVMWLCRAHHMEVHHTNNGESVPKEGRDVA